MKCQHCGGSIVWDHVVTFEGTRQRLVCLSCGREPKEEKEDKVEEIKNEKVRICNKCGTPNPETKEFFHGNGHGGLKHICKKCCNDEYHKKSPWKKKSPTKPDIVNLISKDQTNRENMRTHPVVQFKEVTLDEPFQEYFSNALVKKITKSTVQEIITMIQERFV